MRTVLLAGLVLLAGCTAPGINFYKAVTVTNADGTSSVRSVKVASFAAEFVGLKSFKFNAETGECDIAFVENILGQDQYAVQDKNGAIIGTLTRSVVPGIYTAKVIDAYGNAGKKLIDAAAAGVTGAILSVATPVALGNGLRAIPLTVAQ